MEQPSEVEYTVMILDPSPFDAAKSLNTLASRGWRVVGAYEGDRVILVRATEQATRIP